MDGLLVALWSAPRCRSTAFLRMMAERGDFVVVHEPFSHVVDFGESIVDGRPAHSEAEVIEALREQARDRRVFFKDTTDFRYPGVLADRTFLSEVRHSFMIRHPAEAIASHFRLNARLERDEIGFGRLFEIYDRVRQLSGCEPAVIDAADLMAAPHVVVAEYCTRLGIDFRPHALSWQPGMRTEWHRAARWHQEVSSSTGFQVDTTGSRIDVAADRRLRGYLEYHMPYYQRMHDVRLRIGGPDPSGHVAPAHRVD